MTDHRRKQENFPSHNRMKQLKRCWIERINTLKGLLNQIKELSRKNNEAYSKIIGLDIASNTIEVSDPSLISNSIIMSRWQFEEQVENLKKSSTGKFDSMVEYTYDDIDNWLVEYTNKNDNIETILQNLSIDHREIENELLNIKVK
jgi:predicted double-glycine peptidase